VALVGTGVVALLGAPGTGTQGPLAWLAVACGVPAANGNLVTRCVLALTAGSAAEWSRSSSAAGPRSAVTKPPRH